MGSTPRVLVGGGGPSGLAAAYRLQQAGADVRVLESADRLGGKLRSTDRGGFLIDQGAFFLPTKHARLLAIADELGMSSEVVPGGFVMAVVRDGVIHRLDGDHLLRDLLRTRLLSRKAKLELVKLLPELLRSRTATYDGLPERGAYDDATLADWAASTLSPELQEYLVDAVMRGIFAEGAVTAPRVDFLGILSLFAGARLVAFRGGMGAYPERMSHEVKSELGTEVLSVTEDDRAAEVTWRDAAGAEHTERVDGVVVAVPSAVTRRLVTELDPWRSEYLSRVRDGKLLLLSLGLSRAPAGMTETYVIVPRAEHPFITGVVLDHNKAPGRAPAGRGVLTVGLLDSWCEQHWDDDDPALTATVLTGLERLLPGTRATVELCEVQRWHQEYNQVGHYRELRRFRELCDADRRVRLAGEYLSMGNLDAATRSGEHAARTLLAALGGS